MSRWVPVATAVCCLGGALPCRADDSSVGVPLPGLVSQPRGSVRATAAEVDVDGDAIVLRLQGQASTSARALVLRGPRFGWLGEADAYPGRHFPELRLTWNGVSLPPSTAFAAFAGERDITAELATLGLDPFVIASTPPVIDPPPGRNLPAFKRLLAQRAVVMTEGQPWARWQAQRLWRIDAAQPGANPTPSLDISYQARPGFALLPPDTLAKALPLANYCTSAAQLRARLTEWGLAGGPVVAKTYAVAVGIDGRAPERLSVRVAAPHTVFCGAGGQAVFGAAAPAAARADAAGVLRVLRLDKPG